MVLTVDERLTSVRISNTLAGLGQVVKTSRTAIEKTLLKKIDTIKCLRKFQKQKKVYFLFHFDEDFSF